MYLEKIETGVQDKKLLISIMGVSGCGKTTFGADAPKPIFLPLEDGTFQIDVPRLPRPKNFSEAMKMIDEIMTARHSYETFVVDSIDWLEALIHQEVCMEKGVKNVSEIPYGQGYSASLVKFQEFIQKMKQLREKMNVILICHSQIKTFNDPVTNASYERYTLKLHEKVSAIVKEAVDVLLFANFETFVKKEGLKSRAFGDGKRVMFSQYRAAHDGKSRYNLPYEMPLDWDVFYTAVKSKEPISHDAIKEEISAMLTQVKDEELKKLVQASVEKAANDASQLSKIQNRLRIKLEA